MTLLDRYIQEVMERLPVAAREAAETQLRSRITAQLPEKPGDEDIQKVLEDLGSPALLAEEYGAKKRFLIGPKIYDRYVTVLKLAMVIVPTISAVAAFLESIFNSTTESLSGLLTEILANVLSAAISGAAQTFLWITLIFAIIERKGLVEELNIPKPLKWSVKDLKTDNSAKEGKITRAEVIFGLFFTVIYAAFMYFKPEVIGWYKLVDGDLILAETLFDLTRLTFYIQSVIILAIIQIGIFIYKFVRGHWTFPMAIINAFYNLAISVLYSNMLVDKTLFNKDFIKKFVNLTDSSNEAWTKLTLVVAVLFIIGCTIDTVIKFVKCRRKL